MAKTISKKMKQKITVAETIKEITREHLLKNNGLVLGQCLTAVGWVGGTVPEMTEEDGLVELSMADVSGGGIAVGVALAKRRPIYIVRYQGFQWYNSITIANYAAKSKEMWGIACPMFIRSIAMDGGIGPVASGSHHSIFVRMPGIVVCAPMTPEEYKQVWSYFMSHDDPIYVSEHRRSFNINYEMDNIVQKNADITIFAISSTRLNAIEAIEILKTEGINCNLVHILWLKPFKITELMLQALKTAKFGGLLLDGDFENGAAKSLAYDLCQKSPKKVRVLGLEERAAGFAPQVDNLPPTPQKVANFIKKIVS